MSQVTICTLNGRVLMSQSGEALEAMEANAAQYPGAVASVVSEEEFAALIAAQTPRDIKAEIRAIELRELAPRFTRDLSRKSVLKEAAALGLTEANLLDPNHPAYSPGYVRFMAVEAEIAALRALL